VEEEGLPSLACTCLSLPPSCLPACAYHSCHLLLICCLSAPPPSLLLLCTLLHLFSCLLSLHLLTSCLPHCLPAS